MMRLRRYCQRAFASAVATTLVITPLQSIAAEPSTALPLTGAAYQLADQAYRAYARHDYASAVVNAREALRLRPDVIRLQKLLDQSIAARDAQPVHRHAVSPGVRPAQPAPLGRVNHDAVPVDRGYAAADAAYHAYDRGDYVSAVREAARAVQSSPTNAAYRLLQINSLLANKQLSEAETAMGESIAQLGDDGTLQVRLEALRQQRAATVTASIQAAAFSAATAAYKEFDAKAYPQAVDDIQQALKLTPENSAYQRLLISALIGAKRLEEADEVSTRTLATAPNDGALLAQRGYIRKKLGKAELASADFNAALETGSVPPTLAIGLLADLNRKQEAWHAFTAAIESGALSQMSPLEEAYLAARVGDDKTAYTAFAKADTIQALPVESLQDAAFNATRVDQDAAAIRYHKRAIDASAGLTLKLDPQMHFAARRAVADLTRESGAIVSLTYRGAGTGATVAPGSTGSDTAQLGTEVYWRPFGYRNGRYVELFGRAFDTLYAKDGGATHGASLQGAVGARWKPLSETNAVLSLSRVFSRSPGTPDDWLAQAAWSGGDGRDVRVDVPSWTTTQYYAEAGHYIQQPQSYGLASALAGRSYVSAIGNGKLVLFPHAVLAADYNSAFDQKTATSIGPGINLRYWFREDFYTAPMSWIDLTLQYRFRVSGADRAQGAFFAATMSY